MADIAEMLKKGLADPARLGTLLLDPKKPAEQRARMLLDVIHNNKDQAVQMMFVAGLLQQCTAAGAVAEATRMKEHYEQLLVELENGPVRPATFVAVADPAMPGPLARAQVITLDGQERYPTPGPQVELQQLRPGMTVYLDPKGAVMLSASRALPQVGQQATFVRRIDGTDLVEARLREDKLTLYAARAVLEACAAGTLRHGDDVLICPRRQFALAVVPPRTDRRHRFVDRGRVPDVVASRDIGRPHWVLGYMIRRLKLLLFRKDLLERFDLRPRFSVLLTGPSGCGKTLTVKAFLHEFDKLLTQRTGRGDLGSRVIRVKASELLSEWLGRSDKNIDELFNDIQAVAGETVTTAGGEKLQLPVVVILEEIEGLARRRGEHDAGVYDRIIGTLLQRLDDPTDDLGKLPLILIASSNRPELIDSAMWRRLAGVRASFTRLDREALTAVLGKKLRPHYPFAACNGHGRDEVRAHIIDEVVAALFSPNGDDAALVEVTLRDGKKILKHPRDFLTGAVVEQAVSNAIDQTVFAGEQSGGAEVGLSGAAILEALRRHIDGLADNLTAQNVNDYVDLPEHVQVATLRRLRGPQGSLTTLVARPA
jgi:ATP-dependent 26S proteasome regulatory subunit